MNYVNIKCFNYLFMLMMSPPPSMRIVHRSAKQLQKTWHPSVPVINIRHQPAISVMKMMSLSTSLLRNSLQTLASSSSTAMKLTNTRTRMMTHLSPHSPPHIKHHQAQRVISSRRKQISAEICQEKWRRQLPLDMNLPNMWILIL